MTSPNPHLPSTPPIPPECLPKGFSYNRYANTVSHREAYHFTLSPMFQFMEHPDTLKNDENTYLRHYIFLKEHDNVKKFSPFQYNPLFKLTTGPYTSVRFINALILAKLDYKVILLWLKHYITWVNEARWLHRNESTPQRLKAPSIQGYSYHDWVEIPLPTLNLDFDNEFNAIFQLLLTCRDYHGECLTFWSQQYLTFTQSPSGTSFKIPLQEPFLYYMMDKIIQCAIKNDTIELNQSGYQYGDEHHSQFRSMNENDNDNNGKNNNNNNHKPFIFTSYQPTGFHLISSLLDENDHNVFMRPYTHDVQTLLNHRQAIEKILYFTPNPPPLPNPSITTTSSSLSHLSSKLGQSTTASAPAAAAAVFYEGPTLVRPAYGTTYSTETIFQSIQKKHRDTITSSPGANLFYIVYPDRSVVHKYQTLSRQGTTPSPQIVEALILMSIKTWKDCYEKKEQQQQQRQIISLPQQPLQLIYITPYHRGTQLDKIPEWHPQVYNIRYRSDARYRIGRTPFSKHLVSLQSTSTDLSTLKWAWRNGFSVTPPTVYAMIDVEDRNRIVWPGSRNGLYHDFLNEPRHGGSMDPISASFPLRYTLLLLIHYITTRPFLLQVPFDITLVNVCTLGWDNQPKRTEEVFKFLQSIISDCFTYGQKRIELMNTALTSSPASAQPLTPYSKKFAVPGGQILGETSPTLCPWASIFSLFEFCAYLWKRFLADNAKDSGLLIDNDHYLALIHCLLIQFTQLDYFLEVCDSSSTSSTSTTTTTMNCRSGVLPPIAQKQHSLTTTNVDSLSATTNADVLSYDHSSVSHPFDAFGVNFIKNQKLRQFLHLGGLGDTYMIAQDAESFANNLKSLGPEHFSGLGYGNQLYNYYKDYYPILTNRAPSRVASVFEFTHTIKNGENNDDSTPSITSPHQITSITTTTPSSSTISSPSSTSTGNKTITITISHHCERLIIDAELMIDPLLRFSADFLTRLDYFYPETPHLVERHLNLEALLDKLTSHFYNSTQNGIDIGNGEIIIDDDYDETGQKKDDGINIIPNNHSLTKNTTPTTIVKPRVISSEVISPRDITIPTLYKIDKNNRFNSWKDWLQHFPTVSRSHILINPEPVGFLQLLLNRIDLSMSPILWNLIEICQREFVILSPHVSDKARFIFSTLLMRQYPQILLQKILTKYGPQCDYLFVPVDVEDLTQFLINNLTQIDDIKGIKQKKNYTNSIISPIYQQYARLVNHTSLSKRHNDQRITEQSKMETTVRQMVNKAPKVKGVNSIVDGAKIQLTAMNNHKGGENKIITIPQYPAPQHIQELEYFPTLDPRFHDINNPSYHSIFMKSIHTSNQFNATHLNPSRPDGYNLTPLDYCLLFNAVKENPNLYEDLLQRTNCSIASGLNITSDLDQAYINTISPHLFSFGDNDIFSVPRSLTSNKGSVTFRNPLTDQPIDKKWIKLLERGNGQLVSAPHYPLTQKMKSSLRKQYKVESCYDNDPDHHLDEVLPEDRIKIKNLLEKVSEEEVQDDYNALERLIGNQLEYELFNRSLLSTSYLHKLFSNHPSSVPLGSILDQLTMLCRKQHDDSDRVYSFVYSSVEGFKIAQKGNYNDESSHIDQLYAREEDVTELQYDDNNNDDLIDQSTIVEELSLHHCLLFPYNDSDNLRFKRGTGIIKEKKPPTEDLSHLPMHVRSRMLMTLNGQQDGEGDDSEGLGDNSTSQFNYDFYSTVILNNDESNPHNPRQPYSSRFYTQSFLGEGINNSYEPIVFGDFSIIPPESSLKYARLRNFYHYYHSYYPTILSSDPIDLPEALSNELMGYINDNNNNGHGDDVHHSSSSSLASTPQQQLTEFITKDYITWPYLLLLLRYPNLNSTYDNQKFLCQLLHIFTTLHFDQSSPPIMTESTTRNHDPSLEIIIPQHYMTNIGLELSLVDLITMIYTLFDNNFSPTLIKPFLSLIPSDHLALLYRFSLSSLPSLSDPLCNIKQIGRDDNIPIIAMRCQVDRIVTPPRATISKNCDTSQSSWPAPIIKPTGDKWDHPVGLFPHQVTWTDLTKWQSKYPRFEPICQSTSLGYVSSSLHYNFSPNQLCSYQQLIDCKPVRGVNSEELCKIEKDMEETSAKDPSFVHVHTIPQTIFNTINTHSPQCHAPYSPSSVILYPEVTYPHYDSRYQTNWINLLHNPHFAETMTTGTYEGIRLLPNWAHYVALTIAQNCTMRAGYPFVSKLHDHYNVIPALEWGPIGEKFWTNHTANENYSHKQQFLNQIVSLVRLPTYSSPELSQNAHDNNINNSNSTPPQQPPQGKNLTPTLLDLIFSKPNYVSYFTLLMDHAELSSHIDLLDESPSIHCIGSNYGLELVNRINSDLFNYHNYFASVLVPDLSEQGQINIVSPLTCYDDVTVYQRMIKVIECIVELNVDEINNKNNDNNNNHVTDAKAATVMVYKPTPSRVLVSSLFNHNLISSMLHRFYAFPEPSTDIKIANLNSNLMMKLINSTFSSSSPSTKTKTTTTPTQSPPITQLFSLDYQYPFSQTAASSLILQGLPIYQQFKLEALHQYDDLMTLASLQAHFRRFPGHYPKTLHKNDKLQKDNIKFEQWKAQKTNCNIIDIILIEFFAVVIVQKYIDLVEYNTKLYQSKQYTQYCNIKVPGRTGEDDFWSIEMDKKKGDQVGKAPGTVTPTLPLPKSSYKQCNRGSSWTTFGRDYILKNKTPLVDPFRWSFFGGMASETFQGVSIANPCVETLLQCYLIPLDQQMNQIITPLVTLLKQELNKDGLYPTDNQMKFYKETLFTAPKRFYDPKSAFDGPYPLNPTKNTKEDKSKPNLDQTASQQTSTKTGVKSLFNLFQRNQNPPPPTLNTHNNYYPSTQPTKSSPSPPGPPIQQPLITHKPLPQSDQPQYDSLRTYQSCKPPLHPTIVKIYTTKPSSATTTQSNNTTHEVEWDINPVVLSTGILLGKLWHSIHDDDMDEDDPNNHTAYNDYDSNTNSHINDTPVIEFILKSLLPVSRLHYNTRFGLSSNDYGPSLSLNWTDYGFQSVLEKTILQSYSPCCRGEQQHSSCSSNATKSMSGGMPTFGMFDILTQTNEESCGGFGGWDKTQKNPSKAASLIDSLFPPSSNQSNDDKSTSSYQSAQDIIGRCKMTLAGFSMETTKIWIFVDNSVCQQQRKHPCNNGLWVDQSNTSSDCNKFTPPLDHDKGPKPSNTAPPQADKDFLKDHTKWVQISGPGVDITNIGLMLHGIGLNSKQGGSVLHIKIDGSMDDIKPHIW